MPKTLIVFVSRIMSGRFFKHLSDTESESEESEEEILATRPPVQALVLLAFC